MKLFFELLKSHSRFWGALGLGSFAALDLINTHPGQINTLLGALVTVATVLGALTHDYGIEKAKLAQNSLTNAASTPE